jgi:hypothetical protein
LSAARVYLRTTVVIKMTATTTIYGEVAAEPGVGDVCFSPKFRSCYNFVLAMRAAASHPPVRDLVHCLTTVPPLASKRRVGRQKPDEKTLQDMYRFPTVLSKWPTVLLLFTISSKWPKGFLVYIYIFSTVFTKLPIISFPTKP